MKPAKALELVQRYSVLKRAINGCKPRIGAHLDQCKGLKGHRLDVIKHPSQDLGGFFGVSGEWEEPTKEAQNDQETHLSVWYHKDYGEPGEHGFWRYTVGEGDEAEECPHCFAAHKIIEERKELRKQLSHVTRAMTRFGSAAMDETIDYKPKEAQ